MKRIILSLIFVNSVVLSSISQNVNDLIKTASTVITKSQLSNQDITNGLKEALTVGINKSTQTASKADGFYKNNAIKILFPPDIKKVETKLRAMGMDYECDKFVETLNRGAEDAAKSALPIFVEAIKGLTINDGIKILNGNDNAATQYLKESTTSQLKTTFTPIVRASLAKVQLTKYWKPLANTYNKIPLNKKVNPDLEAYVVNKAIEGLFVLVAAEEYKIRKDPAARVSDILKKVFGAK